MLKWVETRDWEEAFNCIIPKRKFLDGKKKGKDRKSLSETEDVVTEGEGGDITSDQVALKIGAEDLETVVQEDQLLEAQA